MRRWRSPIRTVKPGMIQRYTVFISLLTIILLGGVWALHTWLIADLPSPQELQSRAAVPSTKIYDRRGRLLYEIIGSHAGKHTPLPLEEIPLYLRQATIATEDASFYNNPGVDTKAILRAVLINLRGGEILSGGSTITQQLARNVLLPPEERTQRTLTRKLRETILAWRLARTYSKDEILALYLNETYYGNLAYGVEAAAQAYFGKSAAELDLAECALLAGLPQSPALYNPLEDPEAAQERQAVVLDLMVKHGYIDEAQARLAKEEQLHFASVPFPIRAPHFVMHVRRLLEDELGLATLERGGLQVYTTLDLDMQDTARWIVRRRLAQLSEQRGGLPDRNVRNAAMVALDPWTGEILAMLGSPDYFNPRIDGAVNVTLATRQPGSSIKPITYAAAFDPRRAEPYTPATMVCDVRTSFVTRENNPYVPVNYDHLYRGPVLLRQALASSFNLVAVKVLDHVGLEDMTALARRLGITTLDDSERFGLALTLGGGEVRLLELTAAYAAFANGGHRAEPVAILRVEDSQGNVLGARSLRLRSGQAETFAQHGPETGERVLDERVAYLITDILSDDTARISGFGEGSVLRLSRPAAAKTGTTTDWRDNWTIGYTPELVVGVWAGNADNEPMRHVSGVTGAAPIWHDFMEEVLKGRPVQEFAEPEGLVRVEVCSLSGKLPSPHCPHRKTELFIAGTEPREYCTLHRPVRIDVATGMLATENCPPERVVERVYTFLPAEAVEWGRKQGIPQPPMEYCSMHGQSEADTRYTIQGDESLISNLQSPISIVMTSPDPFSVFRLSPALPLSEQRIEVAARLAEEMIVAELTLYVDGEPLVRLATPPYRSMWPLTPGVHAFYAEGYDAMGRRLTSQPVYVTVME
jgi:1A family penicillin-binding protein